MLCSLESIHDRHTTVNNYQRVLAPWLIVCFQATTFILEGGIYPLNSLKATKDIINYTRSILNIKCHKKTIKGLAVNYLIIYYQYLVILCIKLRKNQQFDGRN